MEPVNGREKKIKREAKRGKNECNFHVSRMLLP
jgi:hypothetical protein